jgi:flavodoxin I
MKNILVLYASLTGVTQDICTTLSDQLTKELPDHTITLMNIRDVSFDQIREHEKVIFGCSTWDHGNPAPDAEEFLENATLDKPDFSHVTFALLGIGDTAYPEFCGALPIIENDLQICQAKFYDEQFTIDGYPTDQIVANMVEWAKKFISA